VERVEIISPGKGFLFPGKTILPGHKRRCEEAEAIEEVEKHEKIEDAI
jgi:hypothetical protein